MVETIPIRNRIWLRRPIIAFLCVAVCLGCSNKGIRPYAEIADLEPKEGDDLDTITFFFSTLDSIRPYIHVFPTGIQTEAPSLDPRQFCAPAQLVAKYEAAVDSSRARHLLLSLPADGYEILGEVEADLVPLLNRKRDPRSYAIERIAPNGKPFREPHGVDWGETFGKLRSNAGELGADAVLEVFCAEGVSSFWMPPSQRMIPIYGPKGQVVGSYAQQSPGGVRESGWQLMGLAVRWEPSVSQPDAPGESTPRREEG